ncbi:MAG: alpha/beta hydrolase [Rhodospirillales bacterium]|nr:alpha/beta hydrolase [Rhodospirillales bacterium]
MDDGVDIFIDDTGHGPAIILAHEFGGDWRTWDKIARDLSQDHRCIRFSARGFLPSDVPVDMALYSQDRQVRDVLAIANTLGLETFHLVGLSMGSFTSLMFALKYADRLLSLTLMGCSSGPRDDASKAAYLSEIEKQIDLLERASGKGAVEWFANDPAYVHLEDKARLEWQTYRNNLEQQSVTGALNTLRTVHWNRVSLFDMSRELRDLNVPTLLIYGDEDYPTIASTNEFLENTLPICRKVFLQNTGHLVHIEEPASIIKEVRRQIGSI